MAFKKTALELVKEIAPTMRCNCDLDNWQPETSTDHSCVCRIHKEAWARYIASENRIYEQGRQYYKMTIEHDDEWKGKSA
jgi:hypothetical protein